MYTNVPSSIIHNSQKVGKPKCPPTGEWMNKNVVYLYNGMLFKNTTEWSTDVCHAWMNLDNIMLSWRSQTQKIMCWKIPFIWNVQNRRIETESRLAVAQWQWRWWVRELGRNGEWPLMHIVFFGGWQKCPKIDHGDGCQTLWIY